MRPILFTMPGSGLRIHSYGVMMFVACAAALAMAVWRARREKVDPNAVYELATWLFLGGVIGARGFYFVQHPEAFHELSDLFKTWQGGNVFYGCILGGLTGSILYWLRRPFPFWRMADAVGPRWRSVRRSGGSAASSTVAVMDSSANKPGPSSSPPDLTPGCAR